MPMSTVSAVTGHASATGYTLRGGGDREVGVEAGDGAGEEEMRKKHPLLTVFGLKESLGSVDPHSPALRQYLWRYQLILGAVYFIKKGVPITHQKKAEILYGKLIVAAK
ncbi:hypothetical protein Pfo_008334 [Paulownia fortunei]|nr:hypothetical protein Pfo_008334 [Paulownia fortunei]